MTIIHPRYASFYSEYKQSERNFFICKKKKNSMCVLITIGKNFKLSQLLTGF